ncbi:MAG: hypothetical protein ACTSYY_06880 [Promethearchaeota archaeon]
MVFGSISDKILSPFSLTINENIKGWLAFITSGALGSNPPKAVVKMRKTPLSGSISPAPK